MSLASAAYSGAFRSGFRVSAVRTASHELPDETKYPGCFRWWEARFNVAGNAVVASVAVSVAGD